MLRADPAARSMPLLRPQEPAERLGLREVLCEAVGDGPKTGGVSNFA